MGSKSSNPTTDLIVSNKAVQTEQTDKSIQSTSSKSKLSNYLSFKRFKKHTLSLLSLILQKGKYDKNDNNKDNFEFYYIRQIKYKKLVQCISSMTMPYIVPEQSISVDNTRITFLIKFTEKELVGGFKNIIKKWELDSGICTKTINTNESYSDCVKFNNSNLFCWFSNIIHIWDILSNCITNEIIIKNEYGYFKGPSINCMIKIDENLIACSSFQYISIIDITTGKNIARVSGHEVQGLEKLSENLLISFSLDDTLKIWDIIKGTCIKTINCCVSNFLKLDKIDGMNMTDLSLFAICYRKDINIYNINSEKSIKTLSGHSKSIELIIKISNSKIASASCDLTIKIWDTISGNCLNTIIGNLTRISYIVKVNKNQIASGSIDGMIKVRFILN